MGLFSKLFGGNASKPEDSVSEMDVSVSVAELSAALESSNGGLRIDALAMLSERARESGDAEAIEAIAAHWPKLLTDSEELVRQRALSLTAIVPASADRESALLPLLDDSVAAVRTAAVWAVARASKSPSPILVAHLHDPSPQTRFAVAAALAQLGDSSGFEELALALDEPAARLEALQALGNLGDARALAPLTALFERTMLDEMDRVQCAGALARLGDSAGKEHLLRALEENGESAPFAAGWAGDLGILEAVPLLEALADEVESPARGASLHALGALRAPGAEARLLRVLSSDDGEESAARLDAAEGLALIGTPTARSALEEAAGRTQDDEVRAGLEDILSELEKVS